MASLFDEAGKAKEFINKLTAIPGRQAYFLDVPGTESAKELSVVEFEATEVIGAPTEVRIVATHPRQLPRADYLNLDAVFTIVPDDGVQKKISGFIDRISNVKTSKDFSQYEIILKSHLGRLAAVHNTQIYQHQSTPDIIATILRRHGIKDHQMSFQLRSRYLKHLFRFQYRVDDLAYVQMLMQKSGIYCYIVETEYGDQVVFADDIDHYLYDPRLIVPYREAAGLEAGGVEAITSLKTHNFTVAQGYTVADYNPESAWERFRDSVNLAPQDTTTYGQPYVYGTHHLDQAGAKWEAQLRHEAALARQVVYEGESDVLELQCARVLETDIVLPDAPQGQVVVEITHSGGRDKPYTNRYKAIPADRRFRLELKPETWPKIAGTLSARICSPDKYTYAYLILSAITSFASTWILLTGRRVVKACRCALQNRLPASCRLACTSSRWTMTRQWSHLEMETQISRKLQPSTTTARPATSSRTIAAGSRAT
ncbi:Rhs element Vgr protein [Paraburkholderia eburnea]|uniref:Rhs element Vgr protein n=1 Tax=Paraburkholderia eburnea TaxID=1189126 RepID=A0A2S4ML22_9BURK|nr:Rhs element Vgr protein [Paraburkholderia eburnea]PRZ24333.1 Rhs element Vgr protein [Paraburkholderia eburnea]